MVHLDSTPKSLYLTFLPKGKPPPPNPRKQENKIKGTISWPDSLPNHCSDFPAHSQEMWPLYAVAGGRPGPQRDGKVCDCWMKAKRKQLSQHKPWRCFQCLLHLEDPAKPCLSSYGFWRRFSAFPFNIRTQKRPHWVRQAACHAQGSVLSNLRRECEPKHPLWLHSLHPSRSTRTCRCVKGDEGHIPVSSFPLISVYRPVTRDHV